MNPISADVPDFPPRQYRMTLTPRPHVARHVRRIVARLLGLWGLPELIDAAGLAVTELIGNVVRHAPGGPCRVVIALRDEGGVRVEVGDASPALPQARTAQALEEDGRGLALLAAITDDWGAERDADGGGKTVWFELTPAAAQKPVVSISSPNGSGKRTGVPKGWGPSTWV